MASISEFLFGRPESMQQFQNFSPQQQQLQNQSISGAMNLLQQLQGGGNDFAPIEQQELNRFNKQIIPSIAERFTALSGGQRSSAFQGALGSAASDLGERLGALRGQYNLGQRGQNINLLNSLFGLGMQPSFESALIPRSPGLFESGLTAFSGGVGSSLGQSFPLLALLKMLGSGNQQESTQTAFQPKPTRLGGQGSLGTPGVPGSFQLPIGNLV